jgi:hypothetical protein
MDSGKMRVCRDQTSAAHGRMPPNGRVLGPEGPAAHMATDDRSARIYSILACPS